MDISLIKLQFKNGQKTFEVCKEGISFLRSLQHKKLRIVVNVSPHKSNLESFNTIFQGALAETPSHIEITSETAQLTISSKIKSLSDNRVILIMNIYDSNEAAAQLLLLGYLSASAIFYHEQTALSHNSQLNQILAGLGRLLLTTDIDELKKEMKYKSGFTKNPYFLCISSKFGPEEFNEFYKYSEAQEDINKALDILIECFPQRNAVQLTNHEIISEIGRQYQKQILGREIFSFQFTGSTLESMCFQFCEAFNSQGHINLTSMYQKVINNQKSRVEDEALEMYVHLCEDAFFNGRKIIFEQNESSVFPLPDCELFLQHEQICCAVVKQSMQCAINCMNLKDYEQVYTRLTHKFNSTFKELTQLNKTHSNELCIQCFQTLQGIPPCQTVNQHSLSQLFKIIKNKIELFQSQCIKVLTGQSYSYSIYETYSRRLFHQLFTKVQGLSLKYMEHLQFEERKQQIQLDQYKYDIRQIEAERKKIEYQYGLECEFIEECKLKRGSEREIPFTHKEHSYSKETSLLKVKIEELEEALRQKNIENNEMIEIIEKFEGPLDKTKHRLTKEISELVNKVNENTSKYYSQIEEIRQVHQFYEETRNKLLLEKERIVSERKIGLQQIADKDVQLQLLIKEKSLLEEVVSEAKKTISNFKELKQTHEEMLNGLQVRIGELTCSQADTENQLENFKKALMLLADQVVKGRSEKLKNFYISSTNQQLKEILKDAVRK